MPGPLDFKFQGTQLATRFIILVFIPVIVSGKETYLVLSSMIGKCVKQQLLPNTKIIYDIIGPTHILHKLSIPIKC